MAVSSAKIGLCLKPNHRAKVSLSKLAIRALGIKLVVFKLVIPSKSFLSNNFDVCFFFSFSFLSFAFHIKTGTDFVATQRMHYLQILHYVWFRKFNLLVDGNFGNCKTLITLKVRL